MRVGSLELDPLSRQVWVGGEAVSLSKKEFALLRALAGEPTRVFTREELLRGVWGFMAMGQTRTLDSHAFRLRQKLNRTGDRFVINVWGDRVPPGRRRPRVVIAVSLGGWLAASGAGMAAGGAWRALTGRMETVARACHELRGPLTAARLGLQLGASTGELSPARLRAIDLELGRAALALEDLDGARVRGPSVPARPRAGRSCRARGRLGGGVATVRRRRRSRTRAARGRGPPRWSCGANGYDWPRPRAT